MEPELARSLRCHTEKVAAAAHIPVVVVVVVVASDSSPAAVHPRIPVAGKSPAADRILVALGIHKIVVRNPAADRTAVHSPVADSLRHSCLLHRHTVIGYKGSEKQHVVRILIDLLRKQCRYKPKLTGC